MEGNGNRTIKILIGVIIGLSTVILFSGIFYILNMQGKIAKLETEQEEQLKRQIETQNMASVQTIQPTQLQPNEKTEQQLQQQINTTNKSQTKTKKSSSNQNKTQSSNTQSSVKRGSLYATKSTSGPVNVRAEPTMNSEIIERLPDDIALRYLSSKGNWYYVVYNVRGYNEYGYIHKSQLAR
jgi:SH3 type 3 domain protein